MASLLTLVVELFVSLVDLAVIFVTDVALRDPLSFVSFAIGALLTTASVAFFGYLSVGALLEWVAGLIGTPGRPPQRAR